MCNPSTRRATLSSHLGGRAPGGTGESGRYAPRWSNRAASAVREVMDSWPSGQRWEMLVELSKSACAWARMEKALSSCLSDPHHLGTALSVLSYLRARLRTLSSPEDQKCACRSFTKTLNKKARALGRVAEAPAPPTATSRGAVSDWRSTDPSTDRRRDPEATPATQGALRAWQIGGLDGALAPQRARRRMAVECARVRGRTPLDFAPRLVNNDSLPTLTSNGYDHWV